MSPLARTLSDSFVDAFRRLRRARGFSLLAAGVLAVGVGATVALYALVRGVVLRPLPYAEPERLVVLVEDPLANNARGWPTSVGRLEDYAAAGTGLADRIAATRPLDTVLVAGGEPERVSGARATGSLFEVLGVRALHGRLLAADDARPEAPPVVVVGAGLWRRRFGGDPSLVGRNLEIDGVSRTVVGIAPASFAWPRATAEFWIPFLPTESERNRGWFALRTVARLAPGASIESATAELRAVATALDDQHPNTEKGTRPRLVPLLDDLLGPTRGALLLLQGAVLLVLAVASANFASLLLARGAAREGELSLRTALGGGRWAIVRLQLVEGATLGLLGALLGLPLGAAALRIALAAAGDSLPRAAEVRFDPAVIAIGFLAAVGAALLGSLPPALAASGLAPASVLRASGRGAGFGRRRRSLAAIVVLEVGAATTLAIAGGLVVRSLARLQAVEVGVETEGVVALELATPGGAGAAPQRAADALERYVSRAREEPGLEAVAAISRLPVVGAAASTGYEIEGRPNPTGNFPVADLRHAGPHALPLLEVPFDAGRDFEVGDRSDAPFVVLVNRAFVRLQFPEGDAVGKRIRLGSEREVWRTIVGVVGDVHLAELERPVEPTIWAPFAQSTFPGSLRVAAIVAKSDLPPAEALIRLERAIRSVDPLQLPTRARPLADAIGSSLAPRRFQLGLLAAFAAITTLLAAAGIYGVTAAAVAERRHELGVRLALGADGSTLGRLVLAQGARLGAAGLALGIAGALASGRLLATLAGDLGRWDGAVAGAVCAIVAVTTLAASLAPALRAVRVSPTTALRDA